MLQNQTLDPQLSLEEERDVCRRLLESERALLGRLEQCGSLDLSMVGEGASHEERSRLIDEHRALASDDRDVAALWEQVSALRWKLALSALDQVRFQVSRRSHPGIAAVELYQAGVLGCWEAAGRFEPARGNRFGTYARWWIRSALGELVGTLEQAMRLPRSARQDMRALADQRGAPAKGSGRRRSSLVAVRNSVSLQQERGDGRSWAETVPSDAPTPQDHLVRRQLAHRLRHAGQRAGLSERHHVILSRRYSDARRPVSYRVLGEELGVSGERVRQLEHQALGRLRESMGVA